MAGLADAGRDVTGADLVVGTSAGATVAARSGSGLDLAELYARQVDPERLGARLASLVGGAADAGAVGRFALDADTVPEPVRRAVVESRSPSHKWPARALRIVAVDAGIGERRVFDNDSGVDLVDAVAASAAVPGVWPPVTTGGRRYVDGGVRSAENADLAAGAAGCWWGRRSARTRSTRPPAGPPPGPVGPGDGRAQGRVLDAEWR
ncbi:patatin-like phospholipase family protein [Saccharothrix syringae]|uniref:patatin-like phospholipase family protein n=1 Tax=Saccharothrix syringae TaxID=103733 RepID=UPI0007C4525F|nr:patatin-like phospholipase family protein [Saccharothrix syringae]